MNIQRYEVELHKRAERLHEHAQQTGVREAYIRAAEFYERAGDWDKARGCREAAARLPEAE